MLAAVGHETRAEDVAVSRELAGVSRLLEHDFEGVARLQIVVEIDAAAEDIGQRQRELDFLTRRIERRDERGRVFVDRGAQRGNLRVLLDGHDFRLQLARTLVIGIEDAKEIVGVDLVFELTKHAVERPDDAIRTLGAKIARIENA